jgi:Cys-tRNA(Pro)/Cys-tRNA(Cys) deacylase
MKEQKTNVMRILEQKKIPYTARSYPHGDQPVDGVSVAQALGQDPASVFKTLVAQSGSGHFYVFVIPVAEELDLKKAARAVGEKSISMLPLKSLTALTGYVRGGCSPVGMKKLFPTTFHESALAQSAIAVSAGKIGEQVLVAPQTLADLVRGSFADLIVDKTKE